MENNKRCAIRHQHGSGLNIYAARKTASISRPDHQTPQRGLRPQPKVAITLRCDEHLSFKTQQPRQFSTTSPVSWPEGQSARALHSCGPVQGSSRRSVTATFRFYTHRVRTVVRTKLMHEKYLCQSPPENLRGATRNQLLVDGVLSTATRRWQSVDLMGADPFMTARYYGACLHRAIITTRIGCERCVLRHHAARRHGAMIIILAFFWDHHPTRTSRVVMGVTSELPSGDDHCSTGTSPHRGF